MIKEQSLTINKRQKKAIKTLHIIEIILETTIVSFALILLLHNLVYIWPNYGWVETAAFLFVALVVLVAVIWVGILLTITKSLGEPIASDSKKLGNIYVALWCSVGFGILVCIIIALNSNAPITASAVLFFFSLLVCGVLFILLLVMIQRFWKKFVHSGRALTRPIIYSGLVVILLSTSLFGSYTTQEPIKFDSNIITDSNLELGQSEIRQNGKDGQKTLTHNLIFGGTTSTSQTEAVAQITAKGSKRYQYMYCSNGSYYSFSAEQYKDPNVGYTHQSQDDCAKGGYGEQTTLADVPPAKTQTTYTPTYRPSTTNCYSLTGYSLTCYSY